MGRLGDKLLVVVDMQKDFISGSLGTKEAQAIVPLVKTKMEEYRNNGSFIWATQDTHEDNYLGTQEGKNLPVKHCIRNTDGWKIIEELSYEGRVFIKYAFGRTALIDEILMHKSCITDPSGRLSDPFDEIELVGVCTDICVVSNALLLKSYFPEIKITVDSRCCAGTTPENHEAALQVMRCCQINVI